MITLLCLKLKYKNNVFLLRGNHECLRMTSSFNFREECLRKYDQEIYYFFLDLFCCLPLAAIVNKRFLAIHGGISPFLKKVNDINKIERFKEIPHKGIFCDILWSDPTKNKNGSIEKLFQKNKSRNCAFFFGQEALTNFLIKNKLTALIRAHEVQFEGFDLKDWGSKKFPKVITIFSAPNYCGTYKNKGAFITFDDDNFNIEQFHFKPSPFYLPQFQNIFDWSIPFVSERVFSMFLTIFRLNSTKEDEIISEKKFETLVEEWKENEKKKEYAEKIKRLFKLKKDHKKLRMQSERFIKEENEKDIKFTDIDWKNKIKNLSKFNEIRKNDIMNESLPNEEIDDEGKKTRK